MVKGKTFTFDNGDVLLSSTDGDNTVMLCHVQGALETLLEELLMYDGDGSFCVWKKGNYVQASLTTASPGELAIPYLNADRGCSCGDPEPSNGGTEIVTGGPTSWLAPGVRLSSVAPSEPPCCTHSDVMGTFSAPSPHAEATGLTGGPSPKVMAARVDDTAKAMDEVRAAMAAAPRGWETIEGGTVEEGRSVLDVALESKPDATEAPEPAQLSAPVSEPNTAPVGVLAAPEEPSGVLLTTRAAELKKVPLGASVSE